MANLPLAFAELLAGGILITAGTTGDTFTQIIQGQITQNPLPGGAGSPEATAAAAGSTSSAAGASSGVSVGPGQYVNPVPGATASRVDQGVDYTGSNFLALGTSKIVAADPSNSGWAGGGYIAGQLLNGPYAGKVWYMAEGLVPHVSVGDIVSAGQQIAGATANPYNGVVGNIEAGWANPASPEVPLAKSTGGYIEGDSTAAGVSFNRLIQSLGGPLGHTVGTLLGDLHHGGLP